MPVGEGISLYDPTTQWFRVSQGPRKTVAPSVKSRWSSTRGDELMGKLDHTSRQGVEQPKQYGRVWSSKGEFRSIFGLWTPEMASWCFQENEWTLSCSINRYYSFIPMLRDSETCLGLELGEKIPQSSSYGDFTDLWLNSRISCKCTTCWCWTSTYFK